jgi:hypothetical protein
MPRPSVRRAGLFAELEHCSLPVCSPGCPCTLSASASGTPARSSPCRSMPMFGRAASGKRRPCSPASSGRQEHDQQGVKCQIQCHAANRPGFRRSHLHRCRVRGASRRLCTCLPSRASWFSAARGERRGRTGGSGGPPSDAWLLALIAGTVSYLHMHMLVARHGQPGWVAALTPFSVDGTIVAASTTLLADSRSGGKGGVLPWALLVAGNVASLAANVAVAEPTLIGRVIAAWPSFALTASYELLT